MIEKAIVVPCVSMWCHAVGASKSPGTSKDLNPQVQRRSLVPDTPGSLGRVL